MTAYIIRRVLYTVPLVLGVCVITFLLFDVAFPPRARAIRELGPHATEASIQDWIVERGWDKDQVWSGKAKGLAHVTDTRFAHHMKIGL